MIIGDDLIGLVSHKFNDNEMEELWERMPKQWRDRKEPQKRMEFSQNTINTT